MYRGIVSEIVRVRLMCLVKHWNSVSYSEHKMWEEVGSNLYDLADDIVECCELPFINEGVGINGIGVIEGVSGAEVVRVFGEIVDMIQGLGEVENSGVKSVLDNVVSEINRKVYLIKMGGLG